MQLYLPWQIKSIQYCISGVNLSRLFESLLSMTFLLSHSFPSAFHTCQPTAFTCGNGRCVRYSYRCDHYNDCGDNSDEVGCLFRTCDPQTEFTCNNGRCISLAYVCNGVNNCYDNGTSDERNCRKLIKTTYCPLGSDSSHNQKVNFLKRKKDVLLHRSDVIYSDVLCLQES